MNRREFLKGTAWMGAAAAVAGCTGTRLGFGQGGSMQDFALRPFKRLRVGVIGLGARGAGAVHRISMIPGCEVAALCDKRPERIGQSVNYLRKNGHPVPRTFNGEEGWKALCDLDTLDIVYICTPWNLHVPNALRALRAGKIPLVEVPAAFTVDECWELVETSEKLRIPCMQLENCVYGEIEMLEFNLARSGVLGEIVHAEGAYIHDLRWVCDPNCGFESDWRWDENRVHKGNRYPTHGLVPICLTMGINRGDRLDYLVSLESDPASCDLYIKHHVDPSSPRRHVKMEMGDINTTLIKTLRGRSIMIQHDVCSPRPYTRINMLSGTKGAVRDFPFRVGFEERVGAGVHKWFDEKKAAEIREKYRHPLWKTAGAIAEKVGGHGGMDFLMDLRWAYCLQNGLPLDMDVYDLATSCSLCELTETSVRNRSRSCDIPDFTRGNWERAAPVGMFDIDLGKMDFRQSARKDEAALNV